jgi:Ni,Fe-hydrogenase III large subunit
MQFEIIIQNRLWRITRIINGIVMTMEKKSTEKIQRMIKIINRLKKENEELKRELNEKNLMLERIT